MIEDGETESLSLSVRAQIRFESERVHDWNEGLDEVQGRAWDGSVLCHVATTLCQHLNGDDAMNEITPLMVLQCRQRRHSQQERCIPRRSRAPSDEG